jgi:hypothetical protein
MEQKRTGYKSGTAELDVSYDGSLSNAQFTTMQSNNNDVTIIDFYYAPVEPDVIKPQLHSNSNAYTGSDDGMLSDVR